MPDVRIRHSSRSAVLFYPRPSLETGDITMKQQDRRIETPYSAKRRSFLKTSAGAAGALAVPGFYGKAALAQQGILGKRLVLAIGDAETKPNSAVQAATRFIRQDKAMMIAGSVSSSVAIALQNTCDRAKTLYFPIISGSSDTTGKDCRRY